MSRRRLRNILWALILILVFLVFGYLLYWVATADEVEIKTKLGIEMTPTPSPTPTNTPTPTPTPTNTPTPTPIAGRIVVDAGHGGRDNGTDYDGIYEKDIALEIAFMLKDKLEANDYDVFMTRTEDEFLNPEDRTAKTDEFVADLIVSIHVNSYKTDTSVNGLEILYGDNNELSKSLAETLLDPVISSTDVKNRGVKYRPELVILRDAKAPSCIIETGFISNKEEREHLQDFLFQDKLVRGIVEGINAYMNLH